MGGVQSCRGLCGVWAAASDSVCDQINGVHCRALSETRTCDCSENCATPPCQLPYLVDQEPLSRIDLKYEQRVHEVGEAHSTSAGYEYECEPVGPKPYYDAASEACVAECSQGMIPKSNGTWRVANATHPAKLIRIVTYCAPENRHEERITTKD